MNFDPENEIIKLCAQGMELEGQNRMEEAAGLFRDAWDRAGNDFEKFTAAHYVARRQKTVVDKLKWDQTALEYALKIKDGTMQGVLPSLYLNIGKCYEDLNDADNARSNYNLARSHADFLSDDGYGTLIRNGIKNGLERVKE